MPIPGFPLVSPSETITAAEALGMVMERFEVSGCTEAEAGAWLTGQVRKGKLALDYPKGEPEPRLWLIQFPNIDRGGDEVGRRFDWRRGFDIRTFKLYPEIRPTREEAMHDLFAALDVKYGLAKRQPDKGEDADTAEDQVEIGYPFTVKRASLVAILDPVRVPLAEAAGIIASHLNVVIEAGFHTLIEAAATKRIRIYGTPGHREQGDRIRAKIWRKYMRGEAVLSTDNGSSTTKRDIGGWSDPYVVRADLEQFLRELTSENTAAETETIPPKRPVNATADQSEKSKLRRRIKKALEAEAEKDPPRARTKADWLELMRRQFGNDAVTDNLFDEAWQKADLPAAWRAPGRRT